MVAGLDAELRDSQTSNSLDFSQLVLGFSSAALHYLGEKVGDNVSVKAKNLELAKHNIDILLLLKEKTKGNLSGDEHTLLEQVLSDLQFKYVETKK